MRILIYSSNNPIAQAAAACAAACHAARRGERVLLASSGPGHLIGALLGQNLSPRPLELESNLAAMEIGALEEVGARWDVVRPTLRSGIVARLRDLSGDELPSFPGMDAVSALLVADRARSTGQFDLVVLAGPAPDSLVRALTLPDVMRWLLRILFGLDRGPGKSRSSQETALIPAALIAPNMTAPLQDVRVVLEEQRARLDPAAGALVRIVTTPIELRLPTLQTDLTGLGLYGLAVDELVVPGAPAEVPDEIRKLYGHEAGPSRPSLRIGTLPTGIADRDEWALRGAALYHDGPVISSPPRTNDNPRELRLVIPFLDPKSLDIAVANEEVVVRIGQFRRHLLLPGLLEGGKLRARVENEVLRLWVE
ncbi:MAG: ATPase [Oscillochloris sp.]|nr:ATPase [Oscillochloris sp.]